MKISDILMDGFQPKDDEEKNIKSLLLKYLRFWYLYVIGVVLFISLAYAYLLYATEEYPVATTILISAKGGDFTQNAVYSELENYQTNKVVENEAEVLKSVSLMKLALQELNFNVSYFIKDNALRDKEIFGSRLPIEVTLHQYDSMAFFNKDMNTFYNIHIIDENTYELEDELKNRRLLQFGQEVETQFGVFSIQPLQALHFPTTVKINFNNPFALPGRYSGRLDVFIVNKLASVLRISLTDPVPEKGILVLNKLIEIYNKEAIRDKNKTAENTIAFIDEQLSELTAELQGIEQEVEAYKMQNRITELSSDAQQYLSNSHDSKNRLSEITVQLDVLKSIETYLINQQDDHQAVPSSLTIQDPTLSNLIAEFNAYHMERERMLRTSEPNNPLVQNLNQQLVTLKRNILENIKNIRSGIEITRNSLLARTTEFDNQSGRIPEIERRLLEISRQQVTKQEHYTYLVQKREEAALSLAATTVSNSRIIDPAMAGNKPVKPNKMVILGFAFVMGLGLPLALVFVKYQLNDKIQVKKDVASKTNVPILGEISRHGGKLPFIISDNVRSPIAEQFRLIRTNIQFTLQPLDHKVILVTSSLSGEGKSFFSLNLALTLAMAGNKVAVCEFDLRKPALLNFLNMDKDTGISDYLMSDSISIADLIIKHPSHPDNIHIFGCGSIPEHPSELMSTPKVEYFVDKLKENYHVVILDSAPVGQVADAFSLSKFADLTAYLMRYNYTPKSMIGFLNESFEEKKLLNPVIILNDATLQTNYGYGYGYGYYKHDKRKPKGKKSFA